MTSPTPAPPPTQGPTVGPTASSGQAVARPNWIPPALSATQIRALMGPLSSSRVSTRSQGGRQLSYVEAWDIRATLIRLFGFGGFDVETIESDMVRAQSRPHPNDNARLIWDVAFKCVVRLTVHATGAVYTEAACSMQSNPDFGEAADFACKTAESDALKRAAVNMGTQFGLSLYNDGDRRDVVRVLVEPTQRDLYGAPEPAGTAEQRQAVADSLGGEIASEAGTQTPPATDSAPPIQPWGPPVDDDSTEDTSERGLPR